MLTLTWDYMSLTLPRYIHLQIYDENTRRVILQRLIDGEQRSIELDIKDYLNEHSSIYMICLNIRHNKYCRNVQLEQIKSPTSSLIVVGAYVVSHLARQFQIQSKNYHPTHSTIRQHIHRYSIVH